uniref:Reverse transcriptase domain-containing protein n=1 Tax=Lactuca sativa TaxID=4236 RepID=A0A9R1VW03_LACSA|nr:hypothetical protein LSAT_V11C400194170 [Lactuca sativa]
MDTMRIAFSIVSSKPVFLDAYKVYYQIHMHAGDEEKTFFHIERGTFCYIKMPFGLRNVGTTHQGLADKVFAPQIRRNIEVYVDDMVIKSRNDNCFLQDITKLFPT